MRSAMLYRLAKAHAVLCLEKPALPVDPFLHLRQCFSQDRLQMKQRRGIMQQLQVGQQFPYRLLFKYRQLSNTLVGDAGALECLAEQCILRAEPVEHRHIAKAALRGHCLIGIDPPGVMGKIAGAADHPLYLMYRIFRFCPVGWRLIDLHLVAPGNPGPDILPREAAAGVDHLARGAEDRPAGAVVLAQADLPGSGIIFLKLQEITAIRSPEAVDGLIRIADDT